MRRTRLNKIGKIGEANREARKRIAEIAREKQIFSCEIMGKGCMGMLYVAPAHRHKRAWYKGDVELLSDYKQWVGACSNCHNEIENDPELTKQEFLRLRGV